MTIVFWYCFFGCNRTKKGSKTAKEKIFKKIFLFFDPNRFFLHLYYVGNQKLQKKKGMIL